MTGRIARLSCALAIGGLDPGGGAGIAADLRAFAAAGAFGCAAVALLTVQSTGGLRSVGAVGTGATSVARQAAEVLRHQRVRAVKVGALGSGANVRAVARLLGRHPELPAVVDTPIAPTRGRSRLLADRAVRSLREALVPRATLLTVNAHEAELLSGQRVTTVGEAHDAAQALVATGARAVLVKGGHLAGPLATDVLALDGQVIELRSQRLDVGDVHGTGCTFAALVAGRLAVRPEGARADVPALLEAVRWAKRSHHASLQNVADVGGRMRALVFRPRRA